MRVFVVQGGPKKVALTGESLKEMQKQAKANKEERKMQVFILLFHR